MSNFQYYTRIYDYIHDYQRLVYDKYSKHGVAFPVTYYNINKNKTVWEDEKIFGGAYERTGDLSGIKWDKYLLIPVYFLEDITTVFDGSEIGYIKAGDTVITIPSSYGILPYPGDMIKFEQSFLRPTDDIYPIYVVSGVETATNAQLTFWKLTVNVYRSRTVDDIEEQLEDSYVFFDYTKKIYTVPQSTFLSRMLVKNEDIKDRLNNLYDPNSGFYFI
jgi:hypothetical protein